MTSSQQKRSIGLRVHLWFVFNIHRLVLPRSICLAGQGIAYWKDCAETDKMLCEPIK